MQEGHNLRKVTFIQAWYRGEKARNQVRKLAKALFKRKHIIRELVQTEERYIRDLSIVTSDFKATLLTKQIITKEQSVALFSNIEEIRSLNELFFATIFSQAQSYTHYKIIFDKVEKQVHFFKLYFEYFNNFPQSNALVAKLSKDNKEFAEFLNAIRVNPKYNQLGLYDYLIKPVQRLPKYVLVMKELRRVTPADHPDLQNIDKVLHMFEKVNISNNEKLNQVINSYKISEIQRNLHLNQITEPGVQFILQQPVSLLSMDGELIQSTLYLLTTSLIVSKRGKNKERVLANVPFKHGGEIMSNEQHYYYKNSFTVQNGEGDSCTLVFQSEEEKQILLQKIYNEIMKTEQRNLQKLHAIGHVKSKHTVAFLKRMNQNDLIPQIQVLGTQERNDSLFKYTIYIIEIKIKSIKQKIFLRFSQLLNLQEKAKQSGIIIKNELIKTTWLLNHQPRKIQERKMNIQRFLKELLSKQEVVDSGSQILNFLGLPEQFYKLPSYNKEIEDLLKKSQISERSTNSQEDVHIKRESKLLKFQRNPSLAKSKRYSIFSSIPQIREQFQQEGQSNPHRNRTRTVSIQDILQANQISMGHFTRLSQKLYRQSQREKEVYFEILIPWLQNEKGFVKEKIAVADGQKVYFLIEKLAEQLQLKYFKDFRLYLERNYFSRLLDDDECLNKIAEEIRAGKYLLVLKKMIYLTEEMEEREIKTDRVRLKIVASQAIYDCKKDKYILSYHSILKLSALIGLAQLFSENSPYDLPEVLSLQLIRSRKIAIRTREMVVNDYTSFYDSSKAWESDYEKIIMHLYNKIRGVSRQNSQTFRLSNIKDNEREFNTTNMGQLAAVSIIYEIKENPFYGSISFIVQMSQEFRQILIAMFEEEDFTENRNCWLVIKYHEIYLYSISLADKLFTVHYDDIHRMVSYPASIEIYLRGKEVDSIKLKTTSSFSIRQIILYYKQYNEMIRKMEENDHFEASILELAREQNGSRDSVIHRGTVSEFFLC